MSSEIKLNPVGTINSGKGRFYLSIKKKYRNALKELEGFSHINIIWWGNRSDSPQKRNIMVVQKPYKNSPDTVGIFATRSEARPNPILMTTAAVIGIDLKKGIVELPWIDADGGSPIIDIKPYHPCSDRVRNVQLPDWCSDWPQSYEDSATFDWSKVFNC